MRGLGKMKIRNGFVSNSSSSSFLIVGITDENTIKKLILKDNFCNEGHGISSGNNFIYTGWLDEDEFWDGDEGQWKTDEEGELINGKYGIDIYQAGLDVSNRLEKEHFRTLKKEFIEKCKKLGVEIDPDKVKLLYGESSSE